jgi:hypothetical protein
MWGQTLAFDSHVRQNLPPMWNVPKGNRWSCEEWKAVMRHLENEMEGRPDVVSYFDEKALERYGTKAIVPYGRFLDICYF